MNRSHFSQRGFTLLELLLALALLGLVLAVVFGALRLSSRSWDSGEDRMERVGQMRIAESFLRSQFNQLFPWRFQKAQGTPLAFTGESDRVRFAAPLVARAGLGGISWYQLAIEEGGKEGKRLVLRRLVPDTDLTAFPDFGEAEKTILAEGVSEIELHYFGREGNQATATEPTWRDHWEDPIRLPSLVRLNIKAAQGPLWPELLLVPMVSGDAGCRWDSFHQMCR
jgi:general secretion pathway protein J